MVNVHDTSNQVDAHDVYLRKRSVFETESEIREQN